MAFNFLERLGSLFGGQSAAPAPAPEAPAETPAEPAPEAVAEAPAAEAYTPETPYTVTEEVAAAPAEAAVVESYPEPAPVAESAGTYVPPISMPTPQWATEPAAAEAPAAEPVAEAAPVAEAPPTPAEPLKSAEELEEERLWGEIDAAWAGGDFGKVTELLDALKAYQPEDAAAIDEKIAAAQYNQASALEQNGELDRALYLYQEAQRRNPNLGEAQFAIERVQAALAPPPAEAAPEPAPEAEAAPAEQYYTVEDGDTLSAIAERYYGDANQWPRIFEANTDQLDNPDVIQPGQTLRIPA